MRRIFFILSIIFYSNILLASALPVDSTVNPRNSKLKSMFRNINLGLPLIFVDYAIPLKSSANSSFSDGMNYYFASSKSSFSCTVPFFSDNYSCRLFALYYKYKPGIEFYWSGFGGRINMDDFINYLTKKYPNHYITNSNYINNSYSFDGAGIGLTYKMHYKKYIIEPKIILGFETQNIYSSSFTFKEIGSNQFTTYKIEKHVENNFQHSFHFLLHLARQFILYKSKPKPVFLETGIKAEYLYAPYTINIKVKEQTYGNPESVNEFTAKTNFSMISFGIFATIYWVK
jgi:hypothetical protein